MPPGAAAYPGPLARVGLWGLDLLRRFPWAEGVVLGTLLLEALHPARPWHTAVLGVALIAYLLATHLAESAGSRGEAAAVLRGQAPVLAAGLGLLVLAAASACCPRPGPGWPGAGCGPPPRSPRSSPAPWPCPSDPLRPSRPDPPPPARAPSLQQCGASCAL